MGLNRILLPLLLIAGLIAGGLYLTREAPPATTDQGQLLLGGRHLYEAKRLELQYDPALGKIEIERGDDGSYRLVEPIEDDASSSMLENMFRVYDSATMWVDTPADEVTDAALERCGLAPDRGGLKIVWRDGEALEVRFGSDSVFGDGIFARVEGAICRVSAALRSSITANLADFRERRVFRNTPDQVQSLRLTRNGDNGVEDEFELVRQSDRFVLKGKDFDLDQKLASDAVSAIVNLVADEFVEGASNVGPRKVSLSVVVEGSFGREQVDIYLTPSGSMYGYATGRDLEFRSKRERYAGVFEIPLQAFRSSLLFPRQVLDDLRGLTIGDREAVFTLEKRGADFELTTPMRSAANPTPVAELLGGLGKLFVAKFVEDDVTDFSKFGLAEDYLTLRLRSAANVVVELRIGSRDGEASYVRRSDQNHVVAVSNEAIDPIRRSWIEYVSLDVIRMTNAALVRRIDCRRGEAGITWLRDDVGEWRVDGATEPDDNVADAFSIARDLIARRVYRRAEVAATLGAPWVFSFETSERTPLYTLEVYRGPDGRPLVGKPDSLVLFDAGAGGKELLSIAPR